MHLSLASKGHYRRFYRYLRQKLIIRFNGKIGKINTFACVPTPEFFEIDDCESVHPWSSARSLEFDAPIWRHSGTLCVANFGANNRSSKEYHQQVLQHLSQVASGIFSHLPYNVLQTFRYSYPYPLFNSVILIADRERWHMGCCVPESILGPSGYIPNQQPYISALSLKSKPCTHAASLDGIARLHQLKAFSWNGVVPTRDLEIFRLVVQNNAGTLTSLEVGVQNDVKEEYRNNDLILVELGLLLPTNGIPPAGQKSFLLALQHLSLGRLHLGECFNEWRFAFNLESLKSLDLVNCHGTVEFFEALVLSGLHLNLRSLKVTVTKEECDREELHMFSSSPLGKVLTSFSGLEELTILTRSRTGYYRRVGKTHRSTNEILPVSSHARTLTRLIYQIHCASSSDLSYLAEIDYLLDSRFPARNLLASLPRLECLGIWIEPMTLVCTLALRQWPTVVVID